LARVTSSYNGRYDNPVEASWIQGFHDIWWIGDNRTGLSHGILIKPSW